MPAEPEDVLEADEMWSFVYEKWNKRWIWTVLCRRTHQIAAFVIGDRSEVTCRKLWEQIPPAYKGCRSYSDFWEAYQLVFPIETHECVGKGRTDQSHGTLVLHLETILCAVCQKNTILFKIGYHA